jgi:isopenicillin N synthase-like dioxygenase
MAIADSLGLDRRFFIDGICKDHLGTLGMMHYPKL